MIHWYGVQLFSVHCSERIKSGINVKYTCYIQSLFGSSVFFVWWDIEILGVWIVVHYRYCNNALTVQMFGVHCSKGGRKNKGGLSAKVVIAIKLVFICSVFTVQRNIIRLKSNCQVYMVHEINVQKFSVWHSDGYKQT